MLHKDILSVIDELIHKSYIEDLNNEYHLIFRYVNLPVNNHGPEGLWGKINSSSMRLMFNYRDPIRYDIYDRNILHNHKVSPCEVYWKSTKYHLPMNY